MSISPLTVAKRTGAWLWEGLIVVGLCFAPWNNAETLRRIVRTSYVPPNTDRRSGAVRATGRQGPPPGHPERLVTELPPAGELREFEEKLR